MTTTAIFYIPFLVHFIQLVLKHQKK